MKMNYRYRFTLSTVINIISIPHRRRRKIRAFRCAIERRKEDGCEEVNADQRHCVRNSKIYLSSSLQIWPKIYRCLCSSEVDSMMKGSMTMARKDDSFLVRRALSHPVIKRAVRGIAAAAEIGSARDANRVYIRRHPLHAVARAAASPRIAFRYRDSIDAAAPVDSIAEKGTRCFRYRDFRPPFFLYARARVRKSTHRLSRRNAKNCEPTR